MNVKIVHPHTKEVVEYTVKEPHKLKAFAKSFVLINIRQLRVDRLHYDTSVVFLFFKFSFIFLKHEY